MKFTGIKIKEHFRLRGISFITSIQVILITLFSLPIAYTLNFIMNYVLIKLDLFQVQTMDLGTGTFNFFIMSLLISVTPGICEEVFFRGMILSAYEQKMQPKYAILLSGIFFGLFHFNLQNLLLPTFLGIVFGYLVYKTGSIISSMIAHTLFNFIGLIVMYFTPESDASDVDAAVEMINDAGVQAIMFLLVVSLIAGGVLYFLIRWLSNSQREVHIGDYLIIRNDKVKVLSIEESFYHVALNDEEKKINKEVLKELDYKIIKKEEHRSYGNISALNYLLIGFVIVLYIGFAFIIYTA